MNQKAQNGSDKGETCCCGSEHHEHDKIRLKEDSCCCSTNKALHQHEQEHKHEDEHNHENQIKGGACCLSHNHETKTSGSCCGAEGGSGNEGGCGCCGNEDVDDKKIRNKAIIKLVVSLAFLVVSFIAPLHDKSIALSILDFAWPAIIICGLPIYKNAIRGLANKKITSSLLISIAMTASIIMGVITAFGYGGDAHESYFFVAGEVAFLMALGSFIESVTVGKSRSAIKSLIQIKPSNAYLKTGKTYTETDVSLVNVDDIVLIKPNETVSVDGEVISGNSAINEANITGESKPVDKTIGDKVFAGTINLSGALEVKVLKKSNQTVLSKLIDYVRDAEKNKAQIVMLADKWAGVLVPSACVISLFVFLISMFAFKVGTFDSVNRAITILVVICPCALALATPIAISAGIGNAGKKGILIKSGIALEALAKIDVVAFDKTGTLTLGELQVSNAYAKSMEKSELLYYAATAEAQSEHPIAKAILKASERVGVPFNTQSISGVGVSAEVDNRLVELKKLSLASEEEYASFYTQESTSNTVTAVYIDGILEGIIEISDTVRDDAESAIAKLKENGYKTVMLTGDNMGAASKVKEQLKLDIAYANLLPEDKVKRIEELKREGSRVLMVGDGVNDAPALSLSDCSLAMGAAGNSVAIETADISLMDNKISKIPRLLALAKRTLMTIKLNITMSLGLNLIAAVLGMLGLLNVVGGALLHNVGSVAVSVNAAILLLYKRKK